MNELIRIIDERAQVAGFEKLDPSSQVLPHDKYWSEGILDNQISYWVSKFASILLVEVNSNTYSDVWASSKRAETYLDALLLRREKDGSIVDGYLVLAVTQINNEIKSFIADIERDTRFVRKHVVYKVEGNWERYQRITPLGLLNSPNEELKTEFIPDNPASVSLLESLAKWGSKELALLHSREWNLNE